MRRLALLECTCDPAITRRRRQYPLPDGIEPQSFYLLDGETWSLIAVVTSEDVSTTSEVTAP